MGLIIHFNVVTCVALNLGSGSLFSDWNLSVDDITVGGRDLKLSTGANFNLCISNGVKNPPEDSLAGVVASIGHHSSAIEDPLDVSQHGQVEIVLESELLVGTVGEIFNVGWNDGRDLDLTCVASLLHLFYFVIIPFDELSIERVDLICELSTEEQVSLIIPVILTEVGPPWVILKPYFEFLPSCFIESLLTAGCFVFFNDLAWVHIFKLISYVGLTNVSL